MNVSLEVKELGDRLGKYTIKWTYTLGALAVIWLISIAASIFLAFLIMVIFKSMVIEIDGDVITASLTGLYVAAAVAAIISVIVVWYMAGRRIAIHEHGIYARNRLGGKVLRWEDLDGIVTDIKETTRHAPAYSSLVDVDPTSIVDNIVGVVLEGAVSANREGRSIRTEHYRLYVNGEEALKIGGNYKDVFQLVHSIEKQITDVHLPRLLERWQQGEIVEIARFSFEPDLVRRLGVIVKWADIQHVTSSGGKITCILKGGKRVDLSAPSTDAVNQHIVTPLLEAIHRASRA